MISRSYAKINLSLKIKGKKDDGYHLLEMVNLPLQLHDIIEFSLLPSQQDTYITCDDIGLSNLKDNLCKKAFVLLKEKYDFKQNFSIHIHKEIPFAAGLGGGSSNAACVLSTLNSALKLRANMQDLEEIGVKIGADVPFFLEGKPRKVCGIGDILSPISVKKEYHCLIVKPEKGLSTKKVYAKYDESPSSSLANTEMVIKGLETGDEALIAKSIGNDLFAPGNLLCPEVGEIYGQIQERGLYISGMTGSGSACFALSTNVHELKDAAKYFEKKGHLAILTKIIC